jgi:hypothetical protein
MWIFNRHDREEENQTSLLTLVRRFDVDLDHRGKHCRPQMARLERGGVYVFALGRCHAESRPGLGSGQAWLIPDGL